VILPLCARCETCAFFRRLILAAAGDIEPDEESLFDDSEAALALPSRSADSPADIHEYGTCIRNPPQFFSAGLEGEWPVIHRSRVCGEYRPNGSQN
jgi:hypothetical protein